MLLVVLYVCLCMCVDVDGLQVRSVCCHLWWVGVDDCVVVVCVLLYVCVCLLLLFDC